MSAGVPMCLCSAANRSAACLVCRGHEPARMSDLFVSLVLDSSIRLHLADMLDADTADPDGEHQFCSLHDLVEANGGDAPIVAAARALTPGASVMFGGGAEPLLKIHRAAERAATPPFICKLDFKNACRVRDCGTKSRRLYSVDGIAVRLCEQHAAQSPPVRLPDLKPIVDERGRS